jgi:hypothetical protein
MLCSTGGQEYEIRLGGRSRSKARRKAFLNSSLALIADRNASLISRSVLVRISIYFTRCISYEHLLFHNLHCGV